MLPFSFWAEILTDFELARSMIMWAQILVLRTRRKLPCVRMTIKYKYITESYWVKNEHRMLGTRLT